MRLYGDRNSGNCLKVKWVSDRLGLAYEWVDIDVMKGETHTAEFLALNPAGQVPVVRFADGRTLAQSNAIMRYLARDSDLIPADPFVAAEMDAWLFWEQYSHEPYIAVCRFQRRYLGLPPESLDPERVRRGYAALDRMEAHLDAADYLVGGALSLADIALLAYTRVAHEGNFDLTRYPAIWRWIGALEAALHL